MQGFKTFVLLAVVVALLGLARAAPADSEPTGLEQLPAMLVLSDLDELSVPAARSCNNSACRKACRARGWKNGICLRAVRCLCYN